MPPKKPPAPEDASKRALRSIDDLHDADPGRLLPAVRRLQRFARLRRRLYFTILGPFGLMSRVLPTVVQTVSVALVAGLVAGTWNRVPAFVTAFLLYYVVGWILYFAVSMRLARLLDEAAASVGLDGGEVLERWAGGAPPPS